MTPQSHSINGADLIVGTQDDQVTLIVQTAAATQRLVMSKSDAIELASMLDTAIAAADDWHLPDDWRAALYAEMVDDDRRAGVL